MMDQLTCHLEHVCEHVSALRVYAHGQCYDAGDPYVFACNVNWLTPDHSRVELGLAIGEMCKEIRQAIVARLIHEGVQHCYAQRHGHRVELIEHGSPVKIEENETC